MLSHPGDAGIGRPVDVAILGQTPDALSIWRTDDRLGSDNGTFPQRVAGAQRE